MYDRRKSFLVASTYSISVALVVVLAGCFASDPAAVGYEVDDNLMDVNIPDTRNLDAGTCDAVVSDAEVHADAALIDSSLPDAATIDGGTTCAPYLQYSGRLLASTGLDIVELTLTGTEIDRFSVPPGGPSGDVNSTIRDLQVSSCGDVFCYRGTSVPAVARRDPLGVWQYFYNPGFSTANNGTYGGLALTEDYVFVTDMNTVNSLEAGVVRYDATTGSAGQRFTNTVPIDLNVGLDGLLYVLDGEESVEVYDADTMAPLFSVLLSQPVRAIAADSTGSLYGASWSGVVYQFSALGTVTSSIDPEIGVLSDIDIDTDGTIAVGSASCYVAITDLALSEIIIFSVIPAFCSSIFVTFTHSGTQ